MAKSLRKICGDMENMSDQLRKPIHKFKPRFTLEEIRKMQKANNDDMDNIKILKNKMNKEKAA